ncbi:hypothetical protein HDU85_007365 [Gaertneriomyces sp. JEL0708]|nr:hypothetical protein HDU85_007365 [Gaertneriomyces sp. JEL0708]
MQSEVQAAGVKYTADPFEGEDQAELDDTGESTGNIGNIGNIEMEMEMGNFNVVPDGEELDYGSDTDTGSDADAGDADTSNVNAGDAHADEVSARDSVLQIDKDHVLGILQELHSHLASARPNLTIEKLQRLLRLRLCFVSHPPRQDEYRLLGRSGVNTYEPNKRTIILHAYGTRAELGRYCYEVDDHTVQILDELDEMKADQDDQYVHLFATSKEDLAPTVEEWSELCKGDTYSLLGCSLTPVAMQALFLQDPAARSKLDYGLHRIGFINAQYASGSRFALGHQTAGPWWKLPELYETGEAAKA